MTQIIDSLDSPEFSASLSCPEYLSYKKQSNKGKKHPISSMLCNFDTLSWKTHFIEVSILFKLLCLFSEVHVFPYENEIITWG